MMIIWAPVYQKKRSIMSTILEFSDKNSSKPSTNVVLNEINKTLLISCD